MIKPPVNGAVNHSFLAFDTFAHMTYPQALDYLYTRLPMFSRIGAAAYKKDLDNTIALCGFLGDPHKKIKTIHVAGTNGKGSVSHMLAAVLQSAGYKTGLYTSPHLKDFRERIRVNGMMIPEDVVTAFTENIKPLADKISPSFFEITVAMAFDFFEKEKVDIAVIETGLGGRLDSTNIITPELSVITNIGYDHMNLLGDTLEKIAFEKAGIIKPGIPAVIGESTALTKPVFEKAAREREAPLYFAAETRQAVNWEWIKHSLMVEVAEKNHTDHHHWELGLTGIYQVKNLLTVLETCSLLQQAGWHIDETSIRNGLKHTARLTGLHGRWELLRHRPELVLDVAHNADGIAQLVRQVELATYRELHIIIGIVKDKDAEQILGMLPKTAIYYFTKARIPRALPETELAAKAEKAGLKGKTFAEVNEALNAALSHAHADDMVIVCGSVYLVGEVNTSVLPAAPGHT